MSDEIVLEPNPDGSWPSVVLDTDQKHRIVTRLPDLHLERLYHDDLPVHDAPFKVELANGKVIEGALDAQGKAVVQKLPALPKRVQFGPDQRPYEVVDQTPNPDYQESGFDPAALVDQHLQKP